MTRKNYCGNQVLTLLAPSKEQQFTQIGNAVPPLFAFQLAQSVRTYLASLSKKRTVIVDIAAKAAPKAIEVASIAFLAEAGCTL